jgi:hypothetical protein
MASMAWVRLAQDRPMDHAVAAKWGSRHNGELNKHSTMHSEYPGLAKCALSGEPTMPNKIAPYPGSSILPNILA